MNFMMQNSMVRSHFRNFGNFDPSYNVTKSKIGAKRAQMYIYSTARVRSLKPFT